MEGSLYRLVTYGCSRCRSWSCVRGVESLEFERPAAKVYLGCLVFWRASADALLSSIEGRGMDEGPECSAPMMQP